MGRKESNRDGEETIGRKKRRKRWPSDEKRKVADFSPWELGLVLYHLTFQSR